MSYIYVITNDINGKQYVGKTNWTIEERFREHIKHRRAIKCEKRPLYNAMNKYGIEHFSIKQLEECSEDIVNEREQYWIQKLDTYGSNGYNATRGGDSKHYYDYKEIADKYLELQNQKATAEYFNCSTKTVRIACKQYSIKTFSNYKQSKKIKMVSLKGKTIQVFDSMSDAGRWLVNNNIAHGKIKNISYNIGQAAKKEKIAYGYSWAFI